MSQRRNLDDSCGAIQRHVLTYVLLLCGCLFGLLGSNLAFAAPPPANSTIGNQASASYTDASGTVRTALSNLVQTTVQQVYSHTLTADSARVVAPGGTAYLAHTLTNTGNGTDTYTLSVAQLTTDSFDLSSVAFYIDANGDGQPDNFTPITSSGVVQAGQSFQFVVGGAVPLTGVANNNTAQIRVGAAGSPSDSNNYTASTTAPTGGLQGNTDTVTVSTGAAITMNKSYSVTSGPSTNTLRVTLTYTNTGTVGGLVQITDTIGGAGSWAGTAFDTREMSYVAGSTKINGVTKTDATDGDEFAAGPDATNGGQKLVAASVAVAAGGTGTMTFDVTVNNATPGAEKTTNIASYLVGATTLATNAAHYSVPVVSTAAVAVGDSRVAGATGGSSTSNQNNLNGAGSGTVADGNSTTDPRDAQALDNGVLLANMPQGGTPVFHVIVTNTGSATDRFNLTVAGTGNTYPAGTTFLFINSTGVPYVDSNSDGIPDTGPLAPNTAMDVFVRVSPPATILPASTGWSANVVTTSINNVSVSDQTAVNVDGTTFVKRTVDIRNNTATGPGAGFASGDALSATSATNAVNPGQSASLTVVVVNTSAAIADSFDLQAFGAYAVNTGAADTTGALPAGWSVKFVSTGVATGSASCPAAGATVTNTGPIAPGGSCAYNAVVTVPAGQAAGTTPVFIRAWSTVYGVDSDNAAAYDVIHDAVTTNDLSAISLGTNGAKQVYPGNYTEFSLKLCNTGNTQITPAGTTITSAHSMANFTNTVVIDANGDGHADASDVAYAASSGALSPGQCVNLVNKVLSPAAAVEGSIDVTTLTATATAGTASVTATVTDSVTVVTSTLSLFKEQATVDCSTGTGVTPQAAFTSGNITNSLPPGSCVRYRITATNIGTSAVSGVTISDTTPTYTSLVTAGGCAVAAAGDTPGTVGGTATNGGVGTVTSTVTSLGLAKTSQLLYCVKLNQ